MSIVPTNVNYTYNLLRSNLISLNSLYPFLNLQIVGNSVMGKNIYVIKLGKGPNKVFYSGGIHANEWITSTLLMKFIEDYATAYVQNSSLYGYNIRNLFNSSSIYIMPMVNPDGVNLVTGSLPTNSFAYERALSISNNFPNIPFPSGWKANINGESLINFHHFIFKKQCSLYYISIVFASNVILPFQHSKFSLFQ